MGTWNSTILADDDAQDIYAHYCRLVNGGQEFAAARQALERSWADTLTDSDDGPVFWLSLALAQWEYAALEESVRERVEQIASKGLGLARWREAGAKPLAAREKAVRDFAASLAKPPKKPKQPKPEKKYPSLYLPGECLAVKLMDGSYGAALVIGTDDRHATEGFDLVTLVDWHSTELPKLSHFAKRKWIKPDPEGRLIPVTRKCYARSHTKAKKQLISLGQIPRRAEDLKLVKGFMGDWAALVRDLEFHYKMRSDD